jgi:hypothetical protein
MKLRHDDSKAFLAAGLLAALTFFTIWFVGRFGL